MYAHGSCLYVYIESSLLYLVSISLHDSNVLVTVEKANQVNFLEEDCSKSTEFHKE
jgi:hypothetical protein